ncbi:FMN-binding negative transcriptional regulator [Moraxella sp. ZJ142]|uniref:FMN-binding negative transcriptional regulator n=1 Tax=Moraxella marmotae TaxID=3344520 RepID=UPI0035D4699D
MFIPKCFAQTDRREIFRLIAEYPLATISYVADGKPCACHVPVIHVVEDGVDKLITHVARANQIWQHTDTPWLLVFMGARHYISPNWYPTKAKTHKEVPTYNYQTVHITAAATVRQQLDGAKQVLAQTTDFFETQLAGQTDHTPWQLDDAPTEYVDNMCDALVAIDLEILDIAAQFKLSQNKPPENQAGVIAGLNQLATPEAVQMANLVAKFAKD